MYSYSMFNKPYGCVSARRDDTFPTVIDYFKELNNDNLKVLLTGGNSIIIKDHLNIDFIYDENLLLEGLLDIYTKNE